MCLGEQKVIFVYARIPHTVLNLICMCTAILCFLFFSHFIRLQKFQNMKNKVYFTNIENILFLKK